MNFKDIFFEILGIPESITHLEEYISFVQENCINECEKVFDIHVMKKLWEDPIWRSQMLEKRKLARERKKHETNKS